MHSADVGCEPPAVLGANLSLWLYTVDDISDPGYASPTNETRPMLRATSVVRRPAVKPDRVVDTLLLDHEARHRRRVAMTGQGGLAFLLDLDRATALDDGDAVKLEDGRLVQVRAAPERLIEIRTDNPLRLMKVGWHLGNRHVATEIGADVLHIGFDHVLLEMVRGLGATAREVERPFRPERGAYEGGHAGHDHGHHDHGHDHGSHAHDHGHAHASAMSAASATSGMSATSAASCGCGHDHHAHAPAQGHKHDHGSHDHAHDHDHGHGHAEHDHAHHD